MTAHLDVAEGPDGKGFGATIGQRARWRRSGTLETIDDGREASIRQSACERRAQASALDSRSAKSRRSGGAPRRRARVVR
jgi:hypothetical protein